MTELNCLSRKNYCQQRLTKIADFPVAGSYIFTKKDYLGREYSARFNQQLRLAARRYQQL